MDGRCSLSDQFSPIVYCPATSSATKQTFQAKPSHMGWVATPQHGNTSCWSPVQNVLHCMQCIYILFLFRQIFSLSENQDIFLVQYQFSVSF